MAQSPVPTIAYLTVANDERTGWTGGLLLLNKGGRPLEFHCTLPVRPTRTHEILFGSTLRQHLIAEIIGPMLIEKCRTPISIICCDQKETLAMSVGKNLPIALVREAYENANRRAVKPQGQSEGLENHSSLEPPNMDVATTKAEVNDASGSTEEPRIAGVGEIASMKTLLLANSRLLVPENQVDRVRNISVQLIDLPDTVEPFERIREAIEEAQSQIARTSSNRPAAAA